MIRVLIVDDSVFIRTILKDIFGRSPEIEVVGTASDGAEALELIDTLRPDAITLDIEMPKLNGLEVLERMKGCRHRPKVMMLSSLTAKDAEHTRKALALGADDFMLKPTEIFKVRGIEEELVTRIKHLIEIRAAVKATGRRDRVARKVVLFGSSAGGLQQLDLVLSRLSSDLDAAVVITQHMPAGFTAALADRFNRICPLPVRESENGTLLKEGEVVISKAGYHTVISAALTGEGIRGGKIVHSSAPPVHAVRPAIDRTFSSAAKVFGKRTLAVVMSGMGSDCGAGAADVKAAGGTVYVCKEHDCLVYGMARSALKTNSVDRTVSLRHIPEEVVEAVGRMEADHG
ncbi:chemotaxis-specific protein-glutamate methyltransferase CheB [Methanofollis formosanus]|uniref:Protein-glutamate methylesterase/protein-glutamine glutaminase n=1 Tax=Methanofollis formosanus TaxID=299308 RepID=A0A8G1A456_9EURY|nr:chemotaxis-specific protein-glutamate methyltransferase CheB [Methanofollis formosanus]QYZ80245.1 chemotaxis-specific protein-glutamate methyltransferase CheB [Methanofollis formosanus]